MSSKTYWEKREAEALKHYLQEEQEYQAQLRAIYQNMLDAARTKMPCAELYLQRSLVGSEMCIRDSGCIT